MVFILAYNQTMQFIVPKFIEREMKIFGPITMKIFVIFLVFVAILILLYFNLPRKTFYIVLSITLPLFFASFFLKVDGIPLYQLYPSLFSFLFSPKVFVWKGKGKFFEEIKLKRKREIPLKKGKSKLRQTQILLQTKRE